jgi:hypothetical protein
MTTRISSIALIRTLLSAEGAGLFERQLAWPNPLPGDLDAVLERLRFAIERSACVADRSGRDTGVPEELEALLRDVEAAIARPA